MRTFPLPPFLLVRGEVIDRHGGSAGEQRKNAQAAVSLVQTCRASTSGKSPPSTEPVLGACSASNSVSPLVYRPWCLSATRRATVRFVFKGQRKSRCCSGVMTPLFSAEAPHPANTTNRNGLWVSPACLLSARQYSFVAPGLRRVAVWSSGPGTARSWLSSGLPLANCGRGWHPRPADRCSLCPAPLWRSRPAITP